MTDPATEIPNEARLEAAGVSGGRGEGSGEATVRKGAVSLSQDEAGGFDIIRARHALKESDQSIKEADAQVERETRAKKSAQRLEQQNVLFRVVVGSMVTLLLVSLTVSLVAENDETLTWARGIVTLIAGGILGGVAGYLTGQQSR